MARDRRPITVEVEWAAGAWTDVTAILDGADPRHGASRRGNPDRPSPAPATGRLLLRDDTPRADSRHRVRLRFGGSTIWTGWIAQPDLQRGAVPRTEWRIEGLLAEALQNPASVSHPGGTVAALVADAALWQALTGAVPSVSQLPSRTFGAVNYDGPVGGFVARFAAAASAAAVERADGTLRLVNVHSATAPRTVASLSAAELLIADVRTVDRVDRIRNTATLVIPEISDEMSTEVTLRLSARLTNYGGGALALDAAALALTATAAEPSDGAAYSGWTARVTRTWIERALKAQSYGGTETYPAGDVEARSRATGVRVPAGQDARLTRVTVPTAASAAAVVGTVDDGAIPVSLTLPIGQPATTVEVHPVYSALTMRGWDHETDDVSADGRRRTANQRTVAEAVAGLGSYMIDSSASSSDTGRFHVFWAQSTRSWAIWGTRGGGGFITELWNSALYPVHAVGADVELVGTRTVGSTTPARDVVTDVEASIAAWGRRPLALPRWLPGTADIAAQLEGLATLRREHTVTLPIRQPTAALSDRVAGIDAGDWVHLHAQDSVRNVDVNHICIVTSRHIVLSPAAEPQLALVCLETAAEPPQPPPGPPRNLVLAAQSATAVDVFWDAPNVGGTVAGYTVRYRVSGSGATYQTVDRTPAQRSLEISGLSGSTTYEIGVRADGADQSSAYVTDTVTTDAAPPGAPTGLVLVAASDTAVLAEWTAPAAGGAVTGYELDWRLDTASDWTSVTGISGVSHEVTGLTAATRYAMRVRATGPGGDSAWTAVARVTTDAAPQAPGPPRNLAVTVGDTRLDLAWDAPNTGGTAASYEVRLDFGTWTSVGSSTTHAFTGLTNDTEYRVSVRARNAVGTSTAVFEDVTPTAAPPNPYPPVRNLRVRQTIPSGQNVWVSVQWDAPTGIPTGYRFDRYRTEYRAGSAAFGNGRNQSGRVSNYQSFPKSGTWSWRVRVLYRRIAGDGPLAPLSDWVEIDGVGGAADDFTPRRIILLDQAPLEIDDAPLTLEDDP